MLLAVTPLVGVWIEICVLHHLYNGTFVTPLVGVWIEINKVEAIKNAITVTPLVGVWIEITCQYYTISSQWSLPLWECGLKYAYGR